MPLDARPVNPSAADAQLALADRLFAACALSLEILLPAYDDAEGVTAAFNRNILVRINRELHGTFDPASFEHLVLYNA
jgi:uncharacterized SAM-dependent methyltransferase